MNIGNYYRNKYAGGGGSGHGGNTVSSGDIVINNGKYKKACKVKAPSKPREPCQVRAYVTNALAW